VVVAGAVLVTVAATVAGGGEIVEVFVSICVMT
jgi:hypothetical protein